MEPMESGLRYRIRRAARQIGEQHRQIREIEKLLGTAIADRVVEDARNAFGRYRGAVVAHFALEEEVFFPALHGLHPERGGELEFLTRQHAGFLAELRSLESLLGEEPIESFARGFGDLASSLVAHETKEEHLVSSLAVTRQSEDGSAS